MRDFSCISRLIALCAFSALILLATQNHFSLTAQLVKSQSDFQPNGRVEVALLLRNISRETVTVGREMTFLDYHCELTDLAHKPVPVSNWVEGLTTGTSAIAGSAHLKNLSPDETLTETIDLSRFWKLVRPGTYHFRATRIFKKPSDEITSNVLTIALK